jgi:hypothetical protein
MSLEVLQQFDRVLVPRPTTTPLSASTMGAEQPGKAQTLPERAKSFLRVRSV